MSDRTCSSCRHWGIRNTRVYLGDQYLACDRIGESNTGGTTRLALIVPDYDEGATLWTLPTFGCVEFEEVDGGS